MGDPQPPAAPAPAPAAVEAPEFTRSEVLSILEVASELTGKNLHGVLAKLSPKLASVGPLPDAAKPGPDGRGSKRDPSVPSLSKAAP